MNRRSLRRQFLGPLRSTARLVLMPRWFLIVFAILLPLQLAWSSVAHLCIDSHEAAAIHAAQHDGAKAGVDQVGDDPCATAGGHCHGHLIALPLSLDVASVAMAGFEGAAPVASLVTSGPSPRPERPQWATLA
jgi:hypothetical protein